MRSTSSILAATLAVAAFVALVGTPVPVNAADPILSGSIKSSAGEAMGGVMVSAKPQGGTITTSVLTDEAGRYYFPPLATGKYRDNLTFGVTTPFISGTDAGNNN